MIAKRFSGLKLLVYLGLAILFTLSEGLTASAGTPLTAEQIEAKLRKFRGSELNIASWGGAFQDAQRKAYFGPFSMRFAIKINEYFPAKNERIIEMVKAGNVIWDVVDFGSFKGDALGEDGYLEELDYTIIDARDVMPNLVSKWHVGSLVWTTLLGYRADVFPGDKAPKKVSDFWDVKRFPGWRSIRNNPIDNVPFALAADGVPYDQIYPITEEKLIRAFKKLDEIKNHVVAWWTVGHQPTQLLREKEVVMAFGMNGRFDKLVKSEALVKMVWDGGHLLGDSWAIPKGAKNKDLAMLFIAWATLPENNWRLSQYITYGPANKKAHPRVPKEILDDMPTSYIDSLIHCDMAWWAQNYNWMVERWQKWKLGK